MLNKLGGREDIYVSFHDGFWMDGTAKNHEINHQYEKPRTTPWLSADTQTLYFASKTAASLGGFDIFFIGTVWQHVDKLDAS